MNLQQSVHSKLEPIFRRFLDNIAENWNLDYEEFAETKTAGTCLHVFTRGKNVGTQCSSKASENGYCGRHQSSVTNTIGTLIIPKNSASKKGPTKTQLQIIEWLNTAVPQTETVLKKRSKGLWHEETDIIFDDEYTVVGKLNKDAIVKLSRFDIEVCEKRGWQYDPNILEDSESE